VEGVEVVIRGGGATRRFATDDMGGGRYRTEIVFPTNGGWDLLVRYGVGSHGSGDEIQLGKGGICVGAELCRAGPLQPKESVVTRSDDGGPMPGLAAAVVAVVLAIALVTVRRGVCCASAAGGD
jgi:hypothetical protein